MGLCRVSAEGLGESDKLASGEGPECVSYGSWGQDGGLSPSRKPGEISFLYFKRQRYNGQWGHRVGEDLEMEDG